MLLYIFYEKFIELVILKAFMSLTTFDDCVHYITLLCIVFLMALEVDIYHKQLCCGICCLRLNLSGQLLKDHCLPCNNRLQVNHTSAPFTKIMYAQI